MEYIVKFRIGFLGDDNVATFNNKEDAVKFATLIRENFKDSGNFYCHFYGFDQYKSKVEF